jgi:hypothetical protein
MVIVWGSRLMGRCDVVPGMFHVATMFGHIFYLPLVPKQSYVVLAQSGDEFRGVPIALSGKSVGLAWARAAVLFFAITSSTAVLIPLMDGKKHEWIGSAIMAAAIWVAFWLITWSKYVTRASVTRACQLGSEIGLNEEGAARLLAIYDNAGGGFDVVQPTAATPAKAATTVAAKPKTAAAPKPAMQQAPKPAAKPAAAPPRRTQTR